MTEKSIKKNFIFNVFYQVLTLVLPFVTIPYISRTLGVEGVGQYSYANSIVSYFLLPAVLGTTVFGQRAIGYAQKNPEERSRAFWEVFLLRAITTTITLVAYLLFVWFASGKDGFTVYLILALSIVNVICDIGWFFQGMEEFGKTVTTSIVFRLLYIAALFLLVKKASDLWIYVLLTVGQVVLGNLVLWVMLPKHLCKVKGINPFRDIRSVIQLFIPTIATQIYVVMDKSMIGWFSDGYVENGYYEQAERVSKISLSLITALGTVMIPRISRYHKEGNSDAVKELVYKSYRFIWLLAMPIMIGLAVIASVFVPIFFGDGYEKCAVLIPILSCLTVFIGLSNVTGVQYLIPTGKQNILTVTVIIGAVANIALNLALIPFFGSIGAAVASIVAELGVTAAGFVYIKRTKQLELRRIFDGAWKCSISGIIMGAAVYVVKLFMPIAVWSLAVLILVGVAVYFVMLLILRDRMVLEILSNVKRILTRKKPEVPEPVKTEAATQDMSDVPPEETTGEMTEEPTKDRTGEACENSVGEPKASKE